MENRSDNFEPFLYELDKSTAQVEKRLEMQLKPATQWLKHIDYLCNELDDTVSVIFSSSQEHISDGKPSKQRSKLPATSPHSQKLFFGKPLPDKPLADKSIPGRLSPTIAQFQELASKTQKELHQLKSQIQKDSPATNLRKL